jgi:hypothetical protein
VLIKAGFIVSVSHHSADKAFLVNLLDNVRDALGAIVISSPHVPVLLFLGRVDNNLNICITNLVTHLD